MARNEHDGRSLEERLASLDAMSGDQTGQVPVPPPPGSEGGEGGGQVPPQAPQQAPAEQENAPPEETVQGYPLPQPPAEQNDPNANPWLAAPPPMFQQAPESPPPENFGPPQPPPYDGGPAPQPFDGGMLPPYSAPGGYQAYDQPQQGAPQPPQPPYPPQQPQYDANGNSAPPLEQLPPYPSEQFPQQDAEATVQPYQPVDPTTGRPYPQDTDAAGRPYVPFDLQTGQPLSPETGQPYPQADPNTGQPYAQVDPNTGQPYAQFDPNTGQAYQQFDPNTGQPYAQFDPNAGQPYAPQDPNAGGQQFPPMDPNAGQPYQQVDPNTGQPYAQYDPNTGQAYQQFDPNTGQPYAPQDPNAGQAYQQFDPNTGQPYAPQDPNAAGQRFPAVDPNTGQAYQQVDPNTGQPLQGYGYPAQPQQAPQQPQNADSLSSENLLGERRIAPSSGWRRAVYKATAGNIHPGESQGDVRRKDLIARARTPVAGGHHRVAVMSLKGGVGKTTTTTGLGSMLGSLRGDTVIAVDANPDRGTLSDKVRLETAATVRDLLNNRDQIHRYADVRAFTSQNNARLEVLASDRDPAVSEAFSADDYAAVAVVLEQYYSICITDCGTGLLHSAMAGVLSLADQLVLVSSPSVDGARSASATLDWLEAHDHGHLVRNGVVVLSMVRNRTRSQVDLDKLQAHFESRCRAVVRIPYDDHLEEGAEVELEQLAPPTREAYLTLAAVVGDGFAYQRPAQP
ncbi:nucleotide-binding protein [Actinomadura soli]|uniref:nucleotide-binding protein n=1 Tax=Actinomadura soli TaxID=2508997 RepID=UPI001E5EC3DF|nr:AAA family ATPase [Actinomadura soli]